MDFSQALELIKQGKRLRRKGWMTFNACIYLMQKPNQPASAYIELRTPNGGQNWSGAPADLLSDDWELIE